MSSFLVKSTIWVMISEIIFNVSGFIIHAVVGRILGPADYGRYGLVVTLTTMVIILIGNGIPTAMAKYISEIFDTNAALVKTIKRQAILLQSIIVGAITIIFFIASPAIAYALNDPTLTQLFQISSLIIPTFAAASFYFSYYTGLHRFGIQSFLKISRSIFRLVFIISLAYFFRVEGSVVGYILAPLSVFLVAYGIDKLKVTPNLNKSCHCERSEAISPEIKKSGIATSPTTPRNDNKFDWKKLIDYAWQIIIFFLAYELLISIDLYLVKGILHNDYLTGIYNGSLTVGRIPYYFFYALTVVLLPAVSKSTSSNNHEDTTKIIGRSLRIMLILLVPSVILMSVFALPIIRLFYSNEYIGAAAPMSILVWGVGFLTIYYVLCFVMSGANKVKKPMIISIVGLAINTILNYILIKKYGINGSAIATSITSALITILMLYYTWKDFKVAIPIMSFAKMIVSGGIIYALSFLFSKSQFIFILWSLILFAIYLLLLYILGEIKKEDLIFLKKSFSKSKN